MQAVTNTFTAEGRAALRFPVGDLLVSWKKGFQSTIALFTIGSSSIGGTDIIPGSSSVIQEWNKYQYFDESDNLLSLDWERSLNMPIGGLASALADGVMDNTSHRYTPHYMGGDGELFTSILPRRPAIINAGFNYNGVDNTIPQFVGLFTKNPRVDRRQGTMEWQAADFIDFLKNKFVDQTSMFTSQRTDQVIDTILQNLGYATAQYELDPGINVIPFGIFEKGTRWADIINNLVQAEYGHFYQDEVGILRFENRQHWDSSPHNNVQKVIFTAEVLDALAPSEDHIINVVEVKSNVREVQANQKFWELSSPIAVPANGSVDIWADFEDPVINVDTPVYITSATTSLYSTNYNSESTGLTGQASISLVRTDRFAHSYKMTFSNSDDSEIYITTLELFARPAKIIKEVYERAQDDSSVTAYEERPYRIENNYIQSQDWAESFAQMILNDYAELENIQEIVIRAKPELQLGDLISWQGRHWRVFGMKTQLDPSIGFVQELKLLQRTIVAYFRIGISTVGGTDKIAP